MKRLRSILLAAIVLAFLILVLGSCTKSEKEEFIELPSAEKIEYFQHLENQGVVYLTFDSDGNDNCYLYDFALDKYFSYAASSLDRNNMIKVPENAAFDEKNSFYLTSLPESEKVIFQESICNGTLKAIICEASNGVKGIYISTYNDGRFEDKYYPLYLQLSGKFKGTTIDILPYVFSGAGSGEIEIIVEVQRQGEPLYYSLQTVMSFVRKDCRWQMFVLSEDSKELSYNIVLQYISEVAK